MNPSSRKKCFIILNTIFFTYAWLIDLVRCVPLISDFNKPSNLMLSVRNLKSISGEIDFGPFRHFFDLQKFRS